MPQVNILPLNIAKKVEISDDNSNLSATRNNAEFSKLIDRHLSDTQGEQAKESKSQARKTLDKNAIEQEEDSIKEHAEKSLDVVKNDDGTEKTIKVAENEPKVATSGNEDQVKSDTDTTESAIIVPEALMSFLNKADATLISQSAPTKKAQSDTSQNIADFTSKQKNVYEAQLQLNAKTAEQSNITNDEKISLDELSPSDQVKSIQAASESLNIDKSLLRKLKTAGMNEEKQAIDARLAKGIAERPVEPVITMDEQSTEQPNAVLSDELLRMKQTNNALPSSDDTKKVSALTGEKLLTKENETIETTENIALKVTSKSDVLTDKKGNLSQSEEQNTLTSKQNANTMAIRAEKNESIDEAAELSKSEHINQTKADKKINDAVSQFTETAAKLQQKITELAQNKAGDTQGTSDKQLSGNQVISDKVIGTPWQSGVVNSDLKEDAAKVKSKKLTVEQSVDVQTTQAKVKEHIVNQATTSTHPGVNNDTNAVPLNKSDNQTSQQEVLTKVSNQSGEELNAGEVSIEHHEDKKDVKVKTEGTINTGFIDVSGKATEVNQHVIDQQTNDALAPKSTVEVMHQQKTNAQLHHETIAIFRKDFADAVKDKVMLMISQKLQQFDITLDPPELGSMQVRVNLQNEQAAVNFVVQSQQAKEALDDNMDKLRNMLAEQGVDVGEANVEQQSQQSADNQTSEHNNHSRNVNLAQADDVVEHTLSPSQVNNALNAVDYYA